MANKKISTVSLVALVVLGLAIIMGIVGVCLDWQTQTMAGISVSATLSDLTAFGASSEYQAMEAMAILTILAAAGTLVLFLLTKLLNWKICKLLTFLASAFLMGCALIALILTFTTPDTMGLVTLSAGIGCWLLSVFGVLGGVFGIVGTVKG